MPISMPSARTIETKLERKVSDFEFASYLMYPKVFTDFALAADTYGPVSVLPTPAYFYGLAAGEELFADIEKGKTLVIVNQAMSGTDSQGMVTVFFELNGQPRRIKVPDRAHGAPAAPPAARRSPAMPPMSARRCRASSPASSFGRPGGQGRRRAGLDRGDEDGNGAACRKGRHDRRSSGQGRRPDRRQGPAQM
jgi:hypothetical protein